ncbi:hypothetical protein G6F42_029116 [Rhizopus arrhizus]|nr:hypothetical protein G6F42_029116 [Rhizopus arrhizus]
MRDYLSANAVFVVVAAVVAAVIAVAAAAIFVVVGDGCDVPLRMDLNLDAVVSSLVNVGDALKGSSIFLSSFRGGK